MKFKELQEKAVSKQQQKLMGLALAYKRGEVSGDKVSDTVKDLAKGMSEKELEDFAKTKHKGLPDKVDEKYTDPQDASYREPPVKSLAALKKRRATEKGKKRPNPLRGTKPLKFESVNEVGLGGTAGTAVRLGTAAAIGGAAYGAKKAVDRFRPTKVAKARQDREDKRQARQAAQDQIKKLRQKERERRTAAVTNTARKAGQAFGKLRKRIGGKPARRPAG